MGGRWRAGVAPGGGVVQCLSAAEVQPLSTLICWFMVEYPTRQLNVLTLPLCGYQRSAVGTSIFAPFGLAVPAGHCGGPWNVPWMDSSMPQQALDVCALALRYVVVAPDDCEVVPVSARRRWEDRPGRLTRARRFLPHLVIQTLD